jgi:hypothetical protein
MPDRDVAGLGESGRSPQSRLSEAVSGFTSSCLCWRKNRFPATETAADGDSVRMSD